MAYEYRALKAKFASRVDPDIEEQMATVSMKLKHNSSEYQMEVTSMCRDIDIVAWSLDDLRPASVIFKNSFELSNAIPIYTRICPLPLQHNYLDRNEINKMLAAGIVTPSNSAFSFPFVIPGKRGGKARFCCLQAAEPSDEGQSLASAEDGGNIRRPYQWLRVLNA